MDWKSIEKDGLPEKDCVCVVCNETRPYLFYISLYQSYFKEFEVSMIGATRINDPITFNATHWMALEIPPKG